VSGADDAARRVFRRLISGSTLCHRAP